MCFRLRQEYHFITQSQGTALKPFLNRLTSRSTLNDQERAAILSLSGSLTPVAAHVDFVRLGQDVEHSCLVVDGLVGRFGQKKDGVRQITCLYIPGDMADLPSVVSPISAWGLVALTKTTILPLSHADLRRIAGVYPRIAESFWRDCVADGSIFSEWVVNVGRRDAIARLAHLLCEIAIRCEVAGQGNRNNFSLPITQSDLADATGLTGVHVNRTLRELRMGSVVTVRGGKVVVQDWAKLVSIGDFTSNFLLFDKPSPRITSTVG
jgi:CRP-like cAMP-binding protein